MGILFRGQLRHIRLLLLGCCRSPRKVVIPKEYEILALSLGQRIPCLGPARAVTRTARTWLLFDERVKWLNPWTNMLSLPRY
jgi:hypothetical protein